MCIFFVYFSHGGDEIESPWFWIHRWLVIDAPHAVTVVKELTEISIGQKHAHGQNILMLKKTCLLKNILI